MKICGLVLALLLSAALPAQGSNVMASYFSPTDFDPSADPDHPAWRGIPGVFADRGPRGEPAPGHRTEIRSRWTERFLYFLFICPYERLHLKPNPTTTEETNKLWEWDVAEVFIGADFNNIRQYKEFQVSPQGEWVDLDIDRDNPKPEGGWRWNSGFQVKARIDEARKIWYGEMKIPISAIDRRKPEPGLEMRINLYRIQGPPPNRVYIAWQPTGAPSYHVPEAFGRLRLEKAPR
ncbi:MAG: carbohydrate-binding family 9-like protein [Bryobacterales bacterium]|nr:carbohydrate-binding family 9-like protein [Bryobacteraceae bacterium]MDW8356015.1 carbohydrate-binding family 9-like protein [Bryobacterales bacterium]